MIRLENVVLRRGRHVLMEDVNWTIYPKERIGIIGANGSGKTSFFNLLLGNLHADAGEIKISKQVRFAHVAQENHAYSGSALNFVLDGDAELRDLERQLTVAEELHDGMKIGEVHEKLGIIDAYTAPARAAQLLAGLGFNQAEQQRSVDAFSGGWRVRLNLAKALMSRSDILLLDEPTNHLDLDAVLWLQDWLQKYPGTLLLISHDRDFLDQTVNQIAHLANQHLKIYSGSYSTFETQRANDLMVQQAAFDKQQRQLQHMQSFVDRFRYKASKARQAQSRLKAIERMEVICAVQTESHLQFHFKKPAQCPNPLIQLEKAQVGYGEKIVLHHLNLSITPKDRIGILGPNGAGKSTLIKLLAGELQAKGGECHIGAGIKIGYFAQHQVEHLHLQESALWHLRQIAERATELELRKYLGTFDFSGDKVLSPVAGFSGGEKSRLALALIIWQRPNLLLLDEPTNHLDMDMRNALSIALQEFEGAMLLVTHDRFLVRSTTDQLLLVADGEVKEFEGDLDDYQRWLFEFRKQQVAPKPAKDVSAKSERKQGTELKFLLKKIAQLETKMDKLQKELTQIESLLADPDLYEPDKKIELQTHLQKEVQLRNDLQAAEETWLQACEDRDRT